MIDVDKLAEAICATSGTHSRPRFTRQICPGPSHHADEAARIAAHYATLVGTENVTDATITSNEHIVTFDETGYGLQHPLRCRPDLLNCEYNRYLADLGYVDEEPGKYVMEISDTSATYPEVTYTPYEATDGR